jgi:chromosome segregation ATPase
MGADKKRANADPPRGEVGAPPAEVVSWLEEELRQAKSQLHKLEQQVEQARNQLWNLVESVQKGEDVLSAVAAHLAAFPHLQDEMRQAKEQLGRLQERQLANQGRIEEAVRQQQAAAEREREEYSASLRRLEATERLSQSYEGRMLAVEENVRRFRDDISLLEKRLEVADKGGEELAGKTARHSEVVKRLEEEMRRLHGEIDALTKQDSILSERAQLLLEQVRRLAEQVTILSEDRVVQQELADVQEHWRMEDQRLDERLKALERAMGERLQHAEDHARALELLESKSQTQAERLAAFQQQIREQRQQVVTYLRKLSQFQERQKRRQLAAMEQELKEMKQRDLKLGSE